MWECRFTPLDSLALVRGEGPTAAAAEGDAALRACRSLRDRGLLSRARKKHKPERRAEGTVSSAHARCHCPALPFQPTERRGNIAYGTSCTDADLEALTQAMGHNNGHCAACHCYICGVPAAQCATWTDLHSMADDKVRLLDPNECEPQRTKPQHV